MILEHLLIRSRFLSRRLFARYHNLVVRFGVFYNSLYIRMKCFLTYLSLIRQGNMSTNRSEKWIIKSESREGWDGKSMVFYRSRKTFWNGVVPCSRTSKSRLKAAFFKGRHFASEEAKARYNTRATIARFGQIE